MTADVNHAYKRMAILACKRAVMDYAAWYEKPGFPELIEEMKGYQQEAAEVAKAYKEKKMPLEDFKVMCRQVMKHQCGRRKTRQNRVENIYNRHFELLDQAENYTDLYLTVKLIAAAGRAMLKGAQTRDRHRKNELKAVEEWIEGERFEFFSGGLQNGKEITAYIRRKIDSGEKFTLTKQEADEWTN